MDEGTLLCTTACETSHGPFFHFLRSFYHTFVCLFKPSLGPNYGFLSVPPDWTPGANWTLIPAFCGPITG